MGGSESRTSPPRNPACNSPPGGRFPAPGGESVDPQCSKVFIKDGRRLFTNHGRSFPAATYRGNHRAHTRRAEQDGEGRRMPRRGPSERVFGAASASPMIDDPKAQRPTLVRTHQRRQAVILTMPLETLKSSAGRSHRGAKAVARPNRRLYARRAHAAGHEPLQPGRAQTPRDRRLAVGFVVCGAPAARPPTARGEHGASLRRARPASIVFRTSARSFVPETGIIDGVAISEDAESCGEGHPRRHQQRPSAAAVESPSGRRTTASASSSLLQQRACRHGCHQHRAK